MYIKLQYWTLVLFSYKSENIEEHIDWLIDWKEFYAVSAIFPPCKKTLRPNNERNFDFRIFGFFHQVLQALILLNFLTPELVWGSLILCHLVKNAKYMYKIWWNLTLLFDLKIVENRQDRMNEAWRSMNIDCIRSSQLPRWH